MNSPLVYFLYFFLNTWHAIWMKWHVIQIIYVFFSWWFVCNLHRYSCSLVASNENIYELENRKTCTSLLRIHITQICKNGHAHLLFIHMLSVYFFTFWHATSMHICHDKLLKICLFSYIYIFNVHSIQSLTYFLCVFYCQILNYLCTSSWYSLLKWWNDTQASHNKTNPSKIISPCEMWK